RSRPCRPAAIDLAANSPNGSAGWPGPPASASSAESAGLVPASLRATLSAIVPGALPERSSGTGTSAQDSAGWPAQGMKSGPEEALDAAGQAEQASALASAMKVVSVARRGIRPDN